MVSIRCKILVQAELEKLNLDYSSVELGEVNLTNDIKAEELNALKIALLKSGLEIIDDKKAVLISRIKAIIIEMIHYSEEPLITKFSNFLSEKLNHDYTYLANLFSEVQGTTIEQFIILHRIERVKELLVYDEYNLTQIAYKMHYSSVAHLSRQFKKVTGLTPSHYKQLKNKRRNNLENLE